LRENFKKRLQEAAEAEENGDVAEMWLEWDQVVCIYLLYFVDITLFNDKSDTCIDVTYLKYSIDLEMVFDQHRELLLFLTSTWS
jgi:hypothetical protein